MTVRGHFQAIPLHSGHAGLRLLGSRSGGPLCTMECYPRARSVPSIVSPTHLLTCRGQSTAGSVCLHVPWEDGAAARMGGGRGWSERVSPLSVLIQQCLLPSWRHFCSLAWRFCLAPCPQSPPHTTYHCSAPLTPVEVRWLQTRPRSHPCCPAHRMSGSVTLHPGS